ERVSLGQQPAGRVGDDLPAVGVVAVQDELLRSPLGGEPERLVADQLVGGEAVVQLHHVDVVGPYAGVGVDALGRGPAHVVADDLHHVSSVEGGRGVGGERLGADGDGGVQSVPPREVGAAHHRGRRAAGGRAALQAGQRPVDARGGQHLLLGQRRPAHRVGVRGGVAPRLDRDLGGRLGGGGVVVGVGLAGAA